MVGHREGPEWRLWPTRAVDVVSEPDTEKTANAVTSMSAHLFEMLARILMSRHFRTDLQPRKIAGMHKNLDFVSDDYNVVGDAKFFTMVRGERLPPAKFSVIAEHVWLLEKLQARERFLVFGNDARVPQEWLSRYGRLVSGIDFYFIDSQSELAKFTFD